MASIYILHSEILDKFYIGSTDGKVELRLKKHLTDHKGFTGSAKDWKVVYTELFPDKHQALLREKKIKSWKSRIKIEELIGKQSF